MNHHCIAPELTLSTRDQLKQLYTDQQVSGHLHLILQVI